MARQSWNLVSPTDPRGSQVEGYEEEDGMEVVSVPTPIFSVVHEEELEADEEDVIHLSYEDTVRSSADQDQIAPKKVYSKSSACAKHSSTETAAKTNCGGQSARLVSGVTAPCSASSYEEGVTQQLEAGLAATPDDADGGFCMESQEGGRGFTGESNSSIVKTAKRPQGVARRHASHRRRPAPSLHNRVRNTASQSLTRKGAIEWDKSLRPVAQTTEARPLMSTGFSSLSWSASASGGLCHLSHRYLFGRRRQQRFTVEEAEETGGAGVSGVAPGDVLATAVVAGGCEMTEVTTEDNRESSQKSMGSVETTLQQSLCEANGASRVAQQQQHYIKQQRTCVSIEQTRTPGHPQIIGGGTAISSAAANNSFEFGTLTKTASPKQHNFGFSPHVPAGGNSVGGDMNNNNNNITFSKAAGYPFLQGFSRASAGITTGAFPTQLPVSYGALADVASPSHSAAGHSLAAPLRRPVVPFVRAPGTAAVPMHPAPAEHGASSHSCDLARVASAAYTKAMSDAARIQWMAAAAQSNSWVRPQPIIIHNTTKATAESQSDALVTAPVPPKDPAPSLLHRWLDVVFVFWQSRLNRILVFGVTSAAAYILWEWWQHKKRMELMQRRIEANPLLRLSQLLSNAGDRNRPRVASSFF